MNVTGLLKAFPSLRILSVKENPGFIVKDCSPYPKELNLQTSCYQMQAPVTQCYGRVLLIPPPLIDG